MVVPIRDKEGSCALVNSDSGWRVELRKGCPSAGPTRDNRWRTVAFDPHHTVCISLGHIDPAFTISSYRDRTTQACCDFDTIVNRVDQQLSP
jgi:hypothetical protein